MSRHPIAEDLPEFLDLDAANAEIDRLRVQLHETNLRRAKDAERRVNEGRSHAGQVRALNAENTDLRREVVRLEKEVVRLQGDYAQLALKLAATDFPDFNIFAAKD